MNEQAVPVLIIFLAIAGIAAFLLRRAFNLLSPQRIDPSPEPTPASKREHESLGDQPVPRSAP